MNREAVNRIKHVGPGGQRCSCCRIPKRQIRAARNRLKRRAIRAGKRELAEIRKEKEEGA